jgi:N6-L-threonylcarbamoyladenine synthase
VGRFTRYGSTLDDAAGEAFDKTAKVLGLGYPGGPALERLAAGGDAAAFSFPPPRLANPCDFSFSGLKTAAARAAEAARTEPERRNLAAAVQAAIARQLALRTAAAMRLHAVAHPSAARLLVVAGGVAANATVRTALQQLCAEQDYGFAAPPLAYCTDNAAMIALAGAERLALGLTDELDAPARPRWPLDEAAALASPTHVPGRKGAKA